MAENTQIAEKKQTFSELMLERLTENEDGLPKGFNKERFVLNAVSLIQEKPELQKFGANQLVAGLMKCAVLDLDVFLKQAYLIPYSNQLQFQIDWRGAKKIAKKYSIRPIKDIQAEIVKDGDVFEKNVTENNTTFTFKPKTMNDGKIIGAFAYCMFEDGGCLVEEMTLAELENTRKHSKQSNGMAWRDYTKEMYLKTVIHRICKKIEISFENAEQLKLFNDDVAIDTKTKPKTDNPFGGDDVECINDDE